MIEKESRNGYNTIRLINTDGIITEVDNTFKRLRIVRTYINYDDIDDITGDDIVEPDF